MKGKRMKSEEKSSVYWFLAKFLTFHSFALSYLWLSIKRNINDIYFRSACRRACHKRYVLHTNTNNELDSHSENRLRRLCIEEMLISTEFYSKYLEYKRRARLRSQLHNSTGKGEKKRKIVCNRSRENLFLDSQKKKGNENRTSM